MNLSEKCIMYRAMHKMTQADLAKQVGLVVGTIQKAESGKPVSKRNECMIRLVVDVVDFVDRKMGVQK